jgi:hypothetical protein
VALPWLRFSRSPAQSLTGYKVPARLGIWNGGAGELTLDPSVVTGAVDPAFDLPPAEKPAPSTFNKNAYGLGYGFQSDGVNASRGSIR